ncbi:HugZ family protein [Chondromyces crocatus]|uniref:Pyridoxamine 5'-phosphate oxidase n=1 Tax=Chondromyces crocatus TaxID=52 RepID=A0A0K1ERP3_CHOCO|nr:DUF2470 domain-containing protein [Chondromyces crocatus]AKT43288.1 pyridoxamine 5'-phosphate oxidase [Chondromyces crocatus]
MSQEQRTAEGDVGSRPSPSHAEQCRTLATRARVAALGTLAQDPAGYPYTSLVAVAFDGEGRPLLLLSELAEHTTNLNAHPEASVLVGEPPGLESGPALDPLASGRMTLLGPCKRIEEPAEAEAARAEFLAARPEAALYAGFGDFAMYRLEPGSIRYVGGFGRVSWVDAIEYKQAAPDPIAPSAAGILSHMNEDHADAVLAYAQALAGIVDATSATMVAVDRHGFELRAATPEGPRSARLGFPREVTSMDQVRVVMVELVREARARLAEQAPGGAPPPS